MTWSTPYVVYRLTNDKKITEIFQCDDLKKAKYWIKYIAESGDVLCRTPVSPKHSKTNSHAEYWCHKETSGQPVTDAKSWLDNIKKYWPEFEFPSEHQQQNNCP